MILTNFVLYSWKEFKCRKANGEAKLIACKGAFHKKKHASWSYPPDWSNVPLVSVPPSIPVNCLNDHGLAPPYFVSLLLSKFCPNYGLINACKKTNSGSRYVYFCTFIFCWIKYILYLLIIPCYLIFIEQERI
jgi:hypothetical protein